MSPDDATFIEMVNQDDNDFNEGLDGWSRVAFDGEYLSVYIKPAVEEKLGYPTREYLRVWRVVT